MDFIEVVSKARPHIKPNSLKSYNSAFKKVLKLKIDLTKPDEVAEGITLIVPTPSQTTKRNMFNVLHVYMDSKGELELGKQYAKKRDLLNAEYVEKNESGIISDKQAPNFITYDELIAFSHKVRADIKDNQRLHMIYAILNFLIYRPLRNDLAGVRLMTPTMFNKFKWEHKYHTEALKDLEENNSSMYALIDGKENSIIEHTKWLKDNPEECYIISQNTKMIFYCNQFATKKTRPQEELEIDGRARIELQKYIKRWGIKSGEVVFPISKNNVSQLLIKTSQKYIQKNISTTLIRKIVSSHKFLDSKLEQEAHAKSIGHSVATENLVYIKKGQ